MVVVPARELLWRVESAMIKFEFISPRDGTSQPIGS